MKSIVLTLFISAATFSGLMGQGLQSPTSYLGAPKKDAWELGLHVGHFFANGNVKFTPGYGGGFHVRRALDYVFSLRLDVLYGAGRGEDNGAVRSYENQWVGGSLQGIISLNNLRWTVGERKHNLYVFGGFGINSFSTDLNDDMVRTTVDHKVATHGDFGAGLSFRINERVNFALEHKATFIFGDRADKVDGVQTVLLADDRQTFRDNVNYTGVRLNINLGKPGEVTEPLYWVNPMEEVIADMTALKGRPFLDLTDTDGDGVIDLQDQQPGTPAGAPVDVRGVALDSDGDGILDSEDQEPFSPPGYPVDGNGVADLPDDMAEVRKYIDERLKNLELKSTPAQPAPSNTVVSGVYLPNIYFGSSGARVTARQYSALGNVATAMRDNPSLRLLVVGHTDEGGNPTFNRVLSYKRAKNTIDELVEKFNVDRSRLILHYRGEADLLVPGVEEVNRRVEFKVARPNDINMEAPM